MRLTKILCSFFIKHIFYPAYVLFLNHIGEYLPPIYYLDSVDALYLIFSLWVAVKGKTILRPGEIFFFTKSLKQCLKETIKV